MPPIRRYLPADDPDPVTDHIAHLRRRNLSDRTVRARRYDLLRLHRHLSGRDLTLRTATLDDLLGWLDACEQQAAHLSPDGRRNLVQSVRMFYLDMADRRDWPNTAGPIPKPQRRRRLPRPMPVNDLHVALIGAPTRIRPWLRLMVDCGLRCVEVSRLRREDLVDVAGRPALHVHGKGGRDRVVPCPPDLAVELRQAFSPSGWVAPRADGQPGPTTPQHVSFLVNRYLHEIGIAGTAHTLRHRAATDWLGDCGNLRVVQELLGHVSAQTTAIYTLVLPSASADVVERVAQARHGGHHVHSVTVT